MTTWKKAPETLIATFDASLPADPRIERRKMFGYPCAFVGGHMFTGLHEDRMIVRLSDADRTELLEEPGTSVFSPLPGRTMREYVVLPPDMSIPERQTWLQRSLAWTATQPAKEAKPKKKAATGR